MSRQILLITGDAGESFECLYASQRLREAGFAPRIAAPSRRRLHLVIHDFEPGWDTYIERPGYGAESDLTFAEASVHDFEAILVLGGGRPSTSATTRASSIWCVPSTRRANGCSRSAMASRCWPPPASSPASR